MTTITALPTPPSRDDPTNFSTRADAFLAALPTFATEANTVAGEVNSNASSASTSASTATTQAGTATTKAAEALASANAAAASALTAANAPGTSATSTTSLTIGTGSQSLTIQAGKALVAGMSVVIAYTTTPTNRMVGTVTSYDSGTGALVVNVTATEGSGTYTAWTVSLTAAVDLSTYPKTSTANTFTVAQTFRAASAIRSEAASTQDAVVVAGRAGGTGSYAVTVTPTTLTANRTATLPNLDITVAGINAAQTWTATQTFKGVTDTVYSIVDGAAFEIDPANGAIQTVTLGASRTPAATNFAAGQSVLLGIDDGTAYSITWTTVNPTWVKVGGTASAPTLATSGYTWVLLWKAGSTIYATEVGKP